MTDGTISRLTTSSCSEFLPRTSQRRTPQSLHCTEIVLAPSCPLLTSPSDPTGSRSRQVLRHHQSKKRTAVGRAGRTLESLDVMFILPSSRPARKTVLPLTKSLAAFCRPTMYGEHNPCNRPYSNRCRLRNKPQTPSKEYFDDRKMRAEKTGIKDNYRSSNTTVLVLGLYFQPS